MTMPEKVGFLVVGAQKSGTSALDEYLRHHPELCLPRQKEVHFFDADELFVTDAVDYARYHANFKPQPQHRLMGEVTPSYLYWPTGAERIAYVERSFYARQLGRLWRYFPREQTIVFKSEELSEAYEDVLDRIAGFLGIGPFPRIAPKTIHARDYEATMSEAEREYLKTVLEPDVRDLERLLGWDCSSWLA